MIIRKENILGARISDIHSTHEVIKGYNVSTIYFTVDRGFSFTLPWAGHEWTTTDLPIDAARIPDEYCEDSFRVKYSWFKRIKFIREPSKKVDIVKRIKGRSIMGIFCYKKEGHDLYEPDGSFLLLNDGSKVYCKSVAPQGISVGLFFEIKEEVQKVENAVDFFDVPLET
jgi:hypothetical protein